MILLSATALAGALLLIAAGVGHLRHRSVLRAALAAQALFPRRAHGAVAACTTVLEIGVGCSVVTTQLATALPVPVRWTPLVAQSGMYLAFAAYLSAARRRRPSAPCGCFSAGGAITWLLVWRAGLLAAGTAGAALQAGGGTAAPSAGWPVLLAAAAFIAMAAWLAPVLTAPP